MRPPSWLGFFWTAASAAALVPLSAAATDLEVALGSPRISFGAAGPLLTRNASVAFDDPAFAVELRTPQCVASAAPRPDTERSGAGTCLEHVRWSGTHELSATLKIPQWQPAAPYIDVSIRSWSDARGADDGRGAASGSAAEVEITQALGRHELFAGYSQPLSSGGFGEWRAAWAGAALRLAPATRLRFVVEASRETRTGMRDTRYTLQLGRMLTPRLRASAFVIHAPDDPAGRWRAGLGLDWPF